MEAEKYISKLSVAAAKRMVTIGGDTDNSPSLHDNTFEMNKNILENILEQRGHYLEEIHFTSNLYLSLSFKVGTIKRIVECCPKLKRISTGCLTLNSEDWVACSHLEELSITYFSNLKAGELGKLFLRNKRLRRLEMINTCCEASDFNHLDPGQLEILHIISCEHFTLTDAVADKLAGSLVELNLNYRTFPSFTHDLQPLSRLKNLRSLILKITVEHLDTEAIVNIAKNCRKLRNITLSIIVQDEYDQNFIKKLCNLPHLESLIIILNVYEIPYEKLYGWFHKAPLLYFFVLSSCSSCIYEEDYVQPCCEHLKSSVKTANCVAVHYNEAVIITAAYPKY